MAGSTASATPRSTARRPATRCASATPTCGSRSSEDLTAGGEEAVFGGGKSIRESMAQSPRTRAEGALDTVITNAIVLDWWGIVRADVGIRDGRIVALGRAGNPDIADGVAPRPGHRAVDRRHLRRGPHPHRRRRSTRTCTCCPPRRSTRRSPPGITTIVGGGTGPSEGSKATTVTPGAWHLRHDAPRARPRCRSTCCCSARATPSARGRRCAEQALAGAAGYKVHEDWGSTPAAIDAALRGADEWGLQVALHSDSLNEAGFVESTIARHRRPLDPRLPRRGRRRRARPRHPDDRGPAERHPRLDEPDAAAHREHRRRAPRHAHGLPPPEPRGARRTSRSPSPASAPRRSRPRTSCTTWAPCRSPPPTRRRWAASARSSPAPGRSRTS